MPRLKNLTTCDLAKRIFADEQLKKKLVEAVLPLMQEPRTAELEQRVLGAIDNTLVHAAGPEAVVPASYNVTCASCALDIIIESPDWENAGLSIQCCVCDSVAMLPLPEENSVAACKVCGAETTIKRISVTT